MTKQGPISETEIKLAEAIAELLPFHLYSMVESYGKLARIYDKLPEGRRQADHAAAMRELYHTLWHTWYLKQTGTKDADNTHKQSKQGMRRLDIDAARTDYRTQETD